MKKILITAKVFDKDKSIALHGKEYLKYKDNFISIIRETIEAENIDIALADFEFANKTIRKLVILEMLEITTLN